MQQFRACAVSHPGTQRDHNEDRFVDRSDLGIWAVADGAGGHEAGEVASEMIANALRTIPGALTAEETLSQVRLRVAATHTALREYAARKGENVLVASTVVILIARQGHFACLWAGDSRAYLLRDGTLQQIMRDHSLVQELVDAGDLAASEAEGHPHANVITRAVGDGAEVMELDKTTGAFTRGDRFLLCSDGLSKALDDATLADILRANAPEPAAEKLIAAALAHHASDNVTAIVMEVVGNDDL